MLRELLHAGHVLVADNYVLEEARRNLAAKGPDSLKTVESITAYFEVAGASSVSIEDAVLAWLPAKDRPVLASAMSLECDALVTGDRTHFGTAYGLVRGGVAIHSPRSLAELLRP